MAEILIVDDERVIREGLKTMLSGEGFAVRAAKNGEEALRMIAARRPDLVLLDVMMPKVNGFRCCEEIRKCDALLPIIFLTAKDSESDQVRGIGSGGDDYVSKAAGEALLLTCIRRAIARAENFGKAAPATFGNTLVLGNVIVDFQTSLVFENGKEISGLTRTESDILKFLAANRGALLGADDIITELRGNGFACEDSMLYAHISNMRKKLGSAASFVVTRRGYGYCLTD